MTDKPEATETALEPVGDQQISIPSREELMMVARVVTRPSDYMFFGNDVSGYKTFMTGVGAKKLLSHVFKSAKIINSERGTEPVERPDGELLHYPVYYVHVRVTRADDIELDSEGYCSGTEPNFRWKKVYNKQTKKKEAKEQLPHQVDYHKIRAIAQTRAYRNAVSALFGIGGQTKEEFAEYMNWPESAINKIKVGGF